MRDYELTVLFKGDLEEKEVDKGVKNLSDLLTKIGAKIKSKKDPAKKVLAYEINKQRDAFYVYFEVSLEPANVLEMETKIRLMDNVLRHLICQANH